MTLMVCGIHQFRSAIPAEIRGRVPSYGRAVYRYQKNTAALKVTVLYTAGGLVKYRYIPAGGIDGQYAFSQGTIGLNLANDVTSAM